MWKDIVKTVAPLLGAAIGGPFGGMAAKAITGAVLGEDKSTDDEDVLKDLLTNPDPETLLKIKEAEQSFKLKMKELGIKESQLSVEDRKSAREMFIATRTWIVPVLAGMTVMGFFSVVGWILTGHVDMDSTLTGYVLGVVSAKAEQVYNFYFGSSHGSKSKTEMLGNK